MASYSVGDPLAFEELYRRYEPRAYRFFARTAKSPERAQDLFQELFLRIHRARASYDCTRPFRPWFYQIASRLLVDDVQRACHVLEIGEESCERASDEVGVLDRLAAREEIERLAQSLSSQERRLIAACKVHDLSYEEVSTQVHKSVGAVKKAVSRALHRMRAVADEACVAEASAPKTR